MLDNIGVLTGSPYSLSNARHDDSCQGNGNHFHDILDNMYFNVTYKVFSKSNRSVSVIPGERINEKFEIRFAPQIVNEIYNL